MGAEKVFIMSTTAAWSRPRFALLRDHKARPWTQALWRGSSNIRDRRVVAPLASGHNALAEAVEEGIEAVVGEVGERTR